MGKCFPYYLLIGAFLLIKCSDDQQIQPPDHFVIPNDKLAFYKIEKPKFYCSEIFIDSVTQLGERVIGYDQILHLILLRQLQIQFIISISGIGIIVCQLLLYQMVR